MVKHIFSLNTLCWLMIGILAYQAYHAHFRMEELIEDSHNLALARGYLLSKEHTEERLTWIRGKQRDANGCLPAGTDFPDDLKEKWRSELIDSFKGDYKRRLTLRFEE